MKEKTGEGFYRKRCRRKDVVDADDVEDFRIKLKFKVREMAELMELDESQYRRCKRKGAFLAFRFNAAIDAIENVALNKALTQVAQLHKIKSGLRLVTDDAINDDAEL